MEQKYIHSRLAFWFLTQAIGFLIAHTCSHTEFWAFYHTLGWFTSTILNFGADTISLLQSLFRLCAPGLFGGLWIGCIQIALFPSRPIRIWIVVTQAIGCSLGWGIAILLFSSGTLLGYNAVKYQLIWQYLSSFMFPVADIISVFLIGTILGGISGVLVGATIFGVQRGVVRKYVPTVALAVRLQTLFLGVIGCLTGGRLALELDPWVQTLANLTHLSLTGVWQDLRI